MDSKTRREVSVLGEKPTSHTESVRPRRWPRVPAAGLGQVTYLSRRSSGEEDLDPRIPRRCYMGSAKSTLTLARR